MNSIVFAQGRGGIQTEFGTHAPITTIDGILEAILNVAVSIGIFVVVLGITYAGFRIVYSQFRGDVGGLSAAKSSLWWTLGGAALILGAYTIKAIILNTVSSIGITFVITHWMI